MDKEVILIRHFEDTQTSEAFRDSDITGVENETLEYLSDIILNKLEKTECKSIVMLSSPLKRSVETSATVSDFLRSKDVETKIICDERLSPLKHGRYISNDVDTLKINANDAWQAFVEQSIEKQNILYRHGDPLIQYDSVEYPSLVGKFISYGENQLEFTIRTYSFLLDLISNYDKQRCGEQMVLVCAHMAPLMRLYELSSLAKNNHGIKETPGRMYIDEWGQIQDIVEDDNVRNIMKTGGLGILDIEELMQYHTEIESELNYLVTLHNSVCTVCPKN